MIFESHIISLGTFSLGLVSQVSVFHIKSSVVSQKVQVIIFTFVGNEAKGRISKRVFQQNKARQIFRQTNISYPLIRTRTYSGGKKNPFWDSPFCLITDAAFIFLCIRFLEGLGVEFVNEKKILFLILLDLLKQQTIQMVK